MQIMEFLGQKGIRWTVSTLPIAMEYIGLMMKDKRIIEIQKDGDIHTVIFFSICNDYEPFYKKEMWEYMKHDPSGEIVYIEKAASREWTKGLRNDVRELILAMYPGLTLGKWHRYGKVGDRPVTIPRRIYV